MIIKLDQIWYIPYSSILCRKPYPGHKDGCPNFNKKPGCPPRTKVFSEYTKSPYYAIINEFNLAEHAARLKTKHPRWSYRQKVCCLYWQQTARKQLDLQIMEWRAHRSLFGLLDMIIEKCPEAHGVNVTKTLHDAGVDLEWPPKVIVRQVAIAGTLK